MKTTPSKHLRILLCAATWLSLGSSALISAQTPAPSPSPAAARAPQIAYIDLVAGPTHGGENDDGVYLSIFGKNLGVQSPGDVRVTLGGAPVRRIMYAGASRGRSDIEQLTVQVGHAGDAAPGTALPVQVTVNGMSSNTEHTFTVQPGNILFVDNVSGNDRSGRPNDPNRPFRRVQDGDDGGALASARPGDVIVLRGKAVWSDVGRDGRWIRFRYATGSKPNGKKGNGYLSIIAYPGETVRFVPRPGALGGIHGIDSRGYPGYSQWIAISGLIIEGGDRSVGDAPINMQAASDHWRIVNNEIGPWDAEDGSKGAEARAGGIAGNGKGLAILGNHIHDIDGGTLNHCIYLDTGASGVEVAYNHLHGCHGGNIIQTFDNLGMEELRDLSIHHNLMHDGNRYGLNIADGTEQVRIWNNVMFDTAFASVRLNIDPGKNSSFLIANNSFAAANRVSQSLNAPVISTWKEPRNSVLTKNIFLVDRDSRARDLVENDSGGSSRYAGNVWIVPTDRKLALPSGDTRLVSKNVAGSDAALLEEMKREACSDSESTPGIDISFVFDDFSLEPRDTKGARNAGAFVCK